MMDVVDLQINFSSIAPGVILAATALVVMLVDAFNKEDAPTAPLAYLGLIGTGVAAAITMVLSRHAHEGFSGMVNLDPFAAFGTVLICFVTGLTLLSSDRDLLNHRMRSGEYYTLILLSASGMAFMMSASDLVLLFLGLELMSIPVYVMAGYNRRSMRSAESAFKYLVLGAFSTAVLLYGASLIYGAVGSTNYAAVVEATAGGALSENVYLLIGTVLVLAAFAFKISAVPFHMWVPDVYQGSPTSIMAFMSAAVKATAFVALARFVITIVGSAGDVVLPVVWALAVASMLVGNVLAYSAVSHAGYLLIAVAVGTSAAMSSMLFYLAVYGLATLGALAAVIALSGGEKGEAEELESWAGIGYRKPLLGAGMTLFMLSLAGIPPTAGFIGKFYLFKEAVAAGMVELAIFGVIGSIIGVYYYIRVIVYMYMHESAAGERGMTLSDVPLNIALIVVTAGTVLFGLLPRRLLEIVQNSVVGLF
jgi:NADH-quinone oxidoreductase subunit N